MGYIEIPGIDRTLDTFTFAHHGLNCFLVPKYLGTSAFGKCNRELFYTFFYLYNHYDLMNPNSGFPPFRDAIEQHVLRNLLGLSLSTHDIPGDFYELITQSLNQGALVLVPVDRGAYFYNKNFGLEHHPHMLLLKGYNPDNRLIMIMDCEQNDKLLNSGLSEPLLNRVGSIYSEFYIPFDILVDWNRSYSENFKYLSGKLQIMQRAEPPAVSTYAEGLAALGRLLAGRLDDVQELIERKLQSLEKATDHRRLVSYLNTQVVLVQTLPKLVAADPRGADLLALGETVVASWKQFNTALMMAQARGGTGGSGNEVLRETLITQENAFLSLLCDICADAPQASQ